MKKSSEHYTIYFFIFDDNFNIIEQINRDLLNDLYYLIKEFHNCILFEGRLK